MNLHTLRNRSICFVLAFGGLLAACGGGEGGGATSLSANTLTNTGSASSITTVGSPITSMKIDSTTNADQSNVPVTFGQVFASGDVSATDVLAGKLGDGTVIPLQMDVKATHPDGSVRHCVISAALPKLTAAQAQTMQIFKTSNGSATGNSGMNQNFVLLNGGFSTGVSINLDGQVYTASADTLLKSGKYKTWLSGSIANEWLVSAPLTNAQGVVHPHLTARFAIRSYTGLGKAKVDVIIENDWAYEPAPSNFTYDVGLSIGGRQVYTKSALTHYHHARWRKTFWWGTGPQVNIRHNTAYLIASRAVPNYDQTLAISSSKLAALTTGFSGAAAEPMATGLATAYMPQTGGRPDIGLLPGWSVMYLLTMDGGAKTAMLGTGDLAGSWSGHYRDKNTDRPVSLVDYPYMTIVGRSTDTYNPVTKKYEAFPDCGGTCTNPNVIDPAHQPSMAYLPYLVTGDQYYLEELQFWAMWNLFQSNPGYRGNVKGLFHQTQVRGQAWILRTLADAAYITPDADPFKAQFATFLSDNLDWYNTAYSNNPSPANTLGAITDENAMVYDSGLGLAPWQDDFFTSAAGHAAELGYAKAAPLLAWKAKFPIGRMTDPGFCWINGSIYNLHMRSTTAGPMFTTFGDAYLASNPSDLTSLACGSAAMASYLGLKTGEMVGYSSENTGFPSNMQPALAYSADSGTAGGSAAWQVFMARAVKPDYSSGPQFDIVPRQ